mgnify:FL=1
MTNNPAVLGAPRADKGATVAVTLWSGKYGVTALDPRGTGCTRARRDRPGPVELVSSIAVEVRPNIGGAEQPHTPGGLVKPPDSMGSHTAIGAAMPPLRWEVVTSRTVGVGAPHLLSPVEESSSRAIPI